MPIVQGVPVAVVNVVDVVGVGDCDVAAAFTVLMVVAGVFGVCSRGHDDAFRCERSAERSLGSLSRVAYRCWVYSFTFLTGHR